MRVQISIVSFALCLSSLAFAEKGEKAKVQKIEKTETININTNNNSKELITTKKEFCGETKVDAEKLCHDWIKEQKQNLKDDLRTTHCSGPRDLYGQEEAGCHKFLVKGEITYLLK